MKKVPPVPITEAKHLFFVESVLTKINEAVKVSAWSSLHVKNLLLGKTLRPSSTLRVEKRKRKKKKPPILKAESY